MSDYRTDIAGEPKKSPKSKKNQPLGSYQKDFDILAKIRYNPLSIISLKDDFFQMVERFSNVFVRKIEAIQEKMQADAEKESTSIVLNARDFRRDPKKSEMAGEKVTESETDDSDESKKLSDAFRKQNYTILLEEKLYYANLFDFCNDLYFDYIAEALVDLARANDPIYLELYIRLATNRTDWKDAYKSSYAKLYNLFDSLKLSDNAEQNKSISHLKSRLYQAFLYTNPKSFVSVLGEAISMGEKLDILAFATSVSKALWLSKREIIQALKSSKDVFIHFHKIADDRFKDRGYVSASQGFIITINNPDLQRMLQHPEYLEWVKFARFIDENDHDNRTLFQDFREVINTVLSHRIASILYPFFLYGVKSALKLSPKYFQILRSMVVLSARNEKEWGYVAFFFRDLSILLFKGKENRSRFASQEVAIRCEYKKNSLTSTLLPHEIEWMDSIKMMWFHFKNWSNVGLVIALGAFLSTIFMPWHFAVFFVVYAFMSIVIRFHHMYMLSTFHTALMYLLIGIFVLNNGLNTEVMKNRAVVAYSSSFGSGTLINLDKAFVSNGLTDFMKNGTVDVMQSQKNEVKNGTGVVSVGNRINSNGK